MEEDKERQKRRKMIWCMCNQTGWRPDYLLTFLLGPLCSVYDDLKFVCWTDPKEKATDKFREKI